LYFEKPEHWKHTNKRWRFAKLDTTFTSMWAQVRGKKVRCALWKMDCNLCFFALRCSSQKRTLSQHFFILVHIKTQQTYLKTTTILFSFNLCQCLLCLTSWWELLAVIIAFISAFWPVNKRTHIFYFCESVKSYTNRSTVAWILPDSFRFASSFKV
jgi:hypothetical protein